MTPQRIQSSRTPIGAIRLFIAFLAALFAASLIQIPTTLADETVNTDTELTGARSALIRILGAEGANKFDLYYIDPAELEGFEGYQVVGHEGRIVIQATSSAVALRGLNDYLGSVGQSLSWTANNIDPANLPVPTEEIVSFANVAHRFYGNDTEDGYTGAFRSWEDWEAEIDMLAAHGFNEVFVPVGAELVYYQTMQEYGYTSEELLEWIPAPTHQPWWLLQNMSQFPTQMTVEAMEERAELGKKIIDRLTELGMKAVIPGYFGTVPNGFADRNEGAVVVDQGGWVGFDRPDWLDPNTDLYADVAATFYEKSAELFGVASMYKMDLLHEGGLRGDVDVPGATAAVEKALQTAAPGATWVLLGWQNNPPSDVAAAVNPETTLIVDGLSDRYGDTYLNRESQWSNVPYAFGTIWNFGGDTTIGAKINVANERYSAQYSKEDSALNGIAVLPEGGNNNAAALDFYAGLAWSTDAVEPTDLDEWFADYAYRRYGSENADAVEAWKIIGQTAYSLSTSQGYSEAQDSVYAAEPSFTASTSSQWSPTTPMYDMDTFATALEPLLAASEELGDNPAYQYDLMDVSRQVLSNTGRILLPQIKEAYDAGDVEAYTRLTQRWMDNLELLDQVTGTSEFALLGTLLDDAQAAGTTEAESDAFEMSQRTIITVWGTQSGYSSGLKDYGGREIQGLIGTYYAPRWEKFFDAGLEALENGTAMASTNWYEDAQPWLNSTDRTGILSEPTGDIVALAAEVIDAARASEQQMPDAPGDGEHFLSDLPFAETDSADNYVIARDKEVGESGSQGGGSITIAGTEFEKGLGMQTPSTVSFFLDGRCSAFTATIGPDDAMSGDAQYPSIIFRVTGDNDQVLYESDTLFKTESEEINVDITGVTMLTLEADSAVEDIHEGAQAEWWDRADWGDAKIQCSVAEEPTAVTPSAPTFDDQGLSVTIPEVDGVEYLIGDQVVSGTVASQTAGTTVTVTAQAAEGYVLAEGATASWTHEFAAAPAPEPSGTVTASPEPSGTVTASPEPSGTVTASPEPSGTVTASPESSSAVTATPSGKASEQTKDPNAIARTGATGISVLAVLGLAGVGAAAVLLSRRRQ